MTDPIDECRSFAIYAAQHCEKYPARLAILSKWIDLQHNRRCTQAMLLGIHHTAIATKNIERLAAFYCDLLGMEKIQDGYWADSPENDDIVGLQGSAARFMLLHARNHCIEMFEYRAPVGQPSDPGRPVCDSGITHFCFGVDDIDAEYSRLNAAGMRFHAPPTPRIEDVPMRATYGRDPDGNVIELLEIVGDTPFDYLPNPARWRRGS